MPNRIWLFVLYALVSGHSLFGLQYTKDIETNYSHLIKKSETLVLHLDEETVHPWVTGSYFQYLSAEKSLAYLNKIGSNIKLFDLTTGKTIKTVTLARFGPDNVGNEPSAFYWLNKDSIFVFSDLNNGRLSLINDKGTRLRNYELQSKDDQHFVELSEVAGGIAYSKGKLYLGLRVASFAKMPSNSSIISLDVKSGEFSYIEHPLPINKNLLPKIPIDQRYASTHIDLNNQERKLIVSLPLSDDILVRDANDMWSTQNAKSVYFDNLVFLRNPVMSYGGTTEKYRDELRFMPRYTGVVFDEFRDVYYRIGRLNYNKELHLRRKSGERLKIYEEFSIQVFNSEFEKIGESKFLAKGLLYEQGLFIDERGLWLLCPQEEDEDEMEFKLMELTKIN